MGPVQNRNQLERVSKLVDLAREGGAKVLCGGEKLEGPGYFYAPAIVRDITGGCPLVDDEQFGPALPVIRYHDLGEAIARANGTPYGLGGSVWSDDKEKAVAVAARFETGSVWVNEHPSIAPHIPFGGIKDSGIGVELSKHGLEAYTNMFVLNCKTSS
jgi:acyl-CoA reductase-like NAD-dependent aldehyde dehydrogenase